jgi:OPA family glycerol-3-phosphate transporter-like MFS transporter/OPA family sugar phosphate sensor protein UhpC-like MFS transporter
MFLTEYKHMDIGVAANVVAASEIVGGIIGTLLAGWATDKFFRSKAHRTCLFCMVLATLCFFIFWRLPQSSKGLAIVFLVLSSFFIYGPQALTGIAASNQATKRAAASANGILGIFGYASTAVSGLVFGMIAKQYGWNTVFAVAIAFGILGCLVFALMWKAPADGYEKAEKIITQAKAGV